MLLGQSRVFYSMSHDGLVSSLFSDLHPTFRTPYKSNAAFFVLTAGFAAFVPEDIVGDMTSIGTLFAFILVSAGVWIMRVKNPDVPRQFRVPMAPVISVLGVITNGLMIYGLGWTNWARLGVWLAIGLVIYFTYGIKHSKLRKELAG
jgi:APA family basic amino acid/polyamine antiporter